MFLISQLLSCRDEPKVGADHEEREGGLHSEQIPFAHISLTRMRSYDHIHCKGGWET